MSSKIRSLNESDLEHVERIAQSFPDNSWTRGVFKDCLKAGYQSYGLFDAKTHDLLGFIVALVQDDDCQPMNIGVDQQCRRGGVGSRLLQHLTSYLSNQQVSRLILEVRQSNTAAISFYEAHGFLQLGIRKGYYPLDKGKEDALIYYINITN